jgi:hypothetical protein
MQKKTVRNELEGIFHLFLALVWHVIDRKSVITWSKDGVVVVFWW